MEKETVTKTYNHDIVGLVARLDRFIVEEMRSVSSAGSEMIGFDQARLTSYLEALKSYHKWFQEEPLLDLVETHPTSYVIPLAPEIADVESEIINDINRLLLICRRELLSSQSALLGSRLNKFDSSRFLATVAKLESFLKNYITPATPLDLPESSPREAMTVPGRRGVDGVAVNK